MSTEAASRGRVATGTWRTFVERRNALNMSQEQAAQYFGVSQTTISAWETKARTPEMFYVPRLSDFFDKTRAEVLEDLSENFLP